MAQSLENRKKGIRNSNIEILRFLLMSFICFWHVIIHGYDFKSIGSPKFDINMNMGIITFFCTLFSPAVYCFMFISGWYGINFSKKKYSYIAFLAISCYLISLFIKYLLGDTIYPFDVITHLFPISCNNWWFLTNYMFVYLIAPFLDSGLKTLSKENIKQILYIMTFIEIASFTQLIPNSGSSFYGLLYIYFLARYMKIMEFNYPLFGLVFIYFISFLILWGVCYWTSVLPGKYAKLSFILLGYNNPLIVIMASSFFFIFLHFKPFYSIRINRSFLNVLSIYLLTDAIGDTLYKYEALTIDKDPLCGIIMVLIIMLLCLLFGEIVFHIFSYISPQNNYRLLYSITKLLKRRN